MSTEQHHLPPHPTFREFVRFYRITSIYLCIVATVIVVLLLADALGILPSGKVDPPPSKCAAISKGIHHEPVR